MIANVLKRLHPPPPAAAMCPTQQRVPSPAAPCPAPGVGPGCAAAASRSDGHLGQTELFIPFTSLKLHEPSAAPRPHTCTRARSRARSRAGGGARTGSRGGAGSWRCCPGGCARRHPALCGDTHVCRRVRVCAALPGTPCCVGIHACAGVCGRVQPCLAPPATPSGLGGLWRRGSGPQGAAQPAARWPRHVPPRTRGSARPRVSRAGVPLPQRWGGPAWEAGGSSR